MSKLLPSVLESRVIAIDEAGIRSGRVSARCSKRSSGPFVDVPCGASGDLNQLLEPFCTGCICTRAAPWPYAVIGNAATSPNWLDPA